jgi:transposase
LFSPGLPPRNLAFSDFENFWNQAKRHMRRFNGVPGPHFHLFLNECEWWFNNPNPKAQQTN